MKGEAGPPEGAEGEEPVRVYPMSRRNREATHTHTEGSRQNGIRFKRRFNVKAGTTLHGVKNF
jgi:hypothetical protein